mgnify:CR=1 FL=1
MYHLQPNQSLDISDNEHVFSLFYEIKMEHPFLDDLYLMGVINKVTGWEYPSDLKHEYKQAISRILRLKN